MSVHSHIEITTDIEIIWIRASVIGMFFIYLTLSQTTNFRLFQILSVADDNFEFDENGRKFSKWLENTAGKGEIARYEQFLLFPQYFQKTCTADT